MLFPFYFHLLFGLFAFLSLFFLFFLVSLFSRLCNNRAPGAAPKQAPSVIQP
jgi:hypothetical protein